MKSTSQYVSPSKGYFKINNGESVYRLMEELSPPMTQDELAEFYESQKQQGNPIPMNATQHIKMFRDAMNTKDPELLNFLKITIRDNYLNTLSRAIYNPKEQKDEVIHNYGTFDAYSLKGNLIGRDGFIEQIDNPKALEFLLETKAIKHLNKISNAINQTPMFLWRVNSRLSEKIEGVLGFCAGSSRLYLSAGGNLSSGRRAFLVEQVK